MGEHMAGTAKSRNNWRLANRARRRVLLRRRQCRLHLCALTHHRRLQPPVGLLYMSRPLGVHVYC